MGKMMKAHRIALLMLGALFAACTSEEIIEEPQQNEAAKVVHFTATLAPKDGSTRSVNKNGVTAWVVGEELAIYYETSGGHATATASVTGVNGGVATIQADLPGAINGGEARFVYPASLHDGTGGIDESKLLNNQVGIGDDISNLSTNFDAATGKGIISVSGETATINGNVGMKNEVCICKITLNFAEENGYVNSESEGGTTLNIYVGDGRTYTITSAKEDTAGAAVFGQAPTYLPFRTGDVIYVAMLPVKAQWLIFSSTDSNGKTYAGAVTGSLEAGKFYRNVPVALIKDRLYDLRNGNGSFTAHNGSIITSGGIRVEGTITIPNGCTVTLDDVSLRARGSAGIICEGNATIVLKGTNSVSIDVLGNYGGSGIQAGPYGTTLTICGSGSLTVKGADLTAGIGSGNKGSCGNITISGGTIMATGGNLAPGIGSGDNGSCGDITITNGVTHVIAIKGVGASFSIGYGHVGSCGIVTIGGTMYYDDFDGGGFQNGGEEYLSHSPLIFEP